MDSGQRLPKGTVITWIQGRDNLKGLSLHGFMAEIT